MASIKGALKKVYKALSGGTNSNAKSISGIIDDISTVATPGGGGGCGTGAFMVNFSFDMQTGQIASADKTPEEIFQACKDGKNVIGVASYALEQGGELAEYFIYFNLLNYVHELDSGGNDTYDALFVMVSFGGANAETDLCDLDVQTIIYDSTNGVSSITYSTYTNKSAE